MAAKGSNAGFAMPASVACVRASARRFSARTVRKADRVICYNASRINMTASFAELFKKYRLKSEFQTISEFGDALVEKGFRYEDSIFSRWQKGTRVPTERKLLLTILQVFIERKAIISLEEANEFLNSAKARQIWAI